MSRLASALLLLLPAALWSAPKSAPDPLAGAMQRALESPFHRSCEKPAATMEHFLEDGLDEDEVVLLALARHPSLRAAGARHAAVTGDLRGARLYPNPALEIEAEEVEPGGNFSGVEFNVLLRQQILTAGRFGKRIRAAKHQKDVAGWAYFEAGVDLAAEARGAFLRVLAAQELVRITQEQVTLAQELVSIVSRRLAAGATNLSEKLRAESFLASVETGHLNAQATLGVAEASLRGLLPGVPRTSQWRGELPAPTPVASTEELVAFAGERSPSLQRLAVAEVAAKARIELARAGRKPNLDVGFGVRRNRGIDDTSYLASIGMPLQVRDRNQGAIARAQAEREEAQANLEAGGLRVRARIEGLHVRLDRLREQARTFEDVVVPKARQALDLTRTGYQRGKFPYLNVLDAQRELATALQNELQVRLQYTLTRVELDQQLGYPRDTRLGGTP